MLREQAALEASDDRRPRLPLPDRLERVDQHDDVQGQIIADVKPDQNLERNREGYDECNRSFLASKNPATIDSVSDTELTMLSPK